MDIVTIQNKIKTYNESKKNFLTNIDKLKNEQARCSAQLDMYESNLQKARESLLQTFTDVGINISDINNVEEVDSAMMSVMQNINTLTTQIYSYNIEIERLLR